MSLSLAEQIKRTFDLASLRYEASLNLSDRDWQTYQRICGRYDEQRFSAERRYREEYDTRVEAARQTLLEKAGKKERSFIPWFGRTDRFDSAALERQAHREVQGRHRAAMWKLDEQEQDEIRSLLSEARSKLLAVAPTSEPERRPQEWASNVIDMFDGPKRPRPR